MRKYIKYLNLKHFHGKKSKTKLKSSLLSIDETTVWMILAANESFFLLFSIPIYIFDELEFSFQYFAVH